jgi:Flp pilus assembly protein protease CpaA
VGFYLFLIYAISYIVFTLIGSLSQTAFAIEFMGMNVGIFYGMSLIIGAIGMAIGFNLYAAKTDHEEEEVKP